jgi:hypothetical protein
LLQHAAAKHRRVLLLTSLNLRLLLLQRGLKRPVAVACVGHLAAGLGQRAAADVHQARELAHLRRLGGRHVALPGNLRAARVRGGSAAHLASPTHTAMATVTTRSSHCEQVAEAAGSLPGPTSRSMAAICASSSALLATSRCR